MKRGTALSLAILAVTGAWTGALVAWLGWSRYAVPRRVELRRTLPGHRVAIATDAGTVVYYADTTGHGRPIVLLHSINAAASAHEMRPLFERFRGERPVYAVDLPGFGCSDRTEREYTAELYRRAIASVLDHVAPDGADVVALSLTSEFAAAVAAMEPRLVRSLTLISPTGFGERDETARLARAGRSGGSAPIRRVLDAPLVGQAFFDTLVTRRSIDGFLRRSFRGRVDRPLLDTAWASAHQPGARHAPFAFLSGKLFEPGPEARYARVRAPVLVLYDTDAYTGFERLDPFVQAHPDWRAERIAGTRGLPQFDDLPATVAALRRFWDDLDAREAARPQAVF